MVKSMTSPAIASIIAGVLVSFGVSLPVSAQVTAPSDAIDDGVEVTPDPNNDPGLPGVGDAINDGDPGLPDVGDTVDDGEPGLPDVGDTTPETETPDLNTTDLNTTTSPTGEIIRLNVNGEVRYYSPITPTDSQLVDDGIPTYTINEGTPTVNDSTPMEMDAEVVDGADNGESENDEFVIYPPADSVEDLEPEDILGE